MVHTGINNTEFLKRLKVESLSNLSKFLPEFLILRFKMENKVGTLKNINESKWQSPSSMIEAEEKEQRSSIAGKIVAFILAMICYGATLYMMIILYIKYQDNLDSSQLSMKEFNQSPTGRYPSFTFCIYGEDGVMFDGEKLQQKYGVGKKDFYEFLSGEKEIANLTTAEIDFEELILGIDGILNQFAVEDDTYEKYNEWETSMGVEKIPLIPFVSKYSDPTTNCFDYSTPLDPNITLNALKLKFNITSFVKIFTKEARMYFQAHYPGQLIRDMKTYLFKASNWHMIGPDHKNNQILAQFPGVTLMRFRENALDPCDPHLFDDDAEWKQYVITKVGCCPIYWNEKHDDHHDHDESCDTMKVCTSSEELMKLKEYWPMYGGKLANEPFRRYTKPCNKMSIFNNINRIAYNDHPDLLKVKFRIREVLYQEVLNNRGFGVDDLWGNIGGYVGIFCGYSILQGAASLVEKLSLIAAKFIKM